ncbi:MAG: hypothetical protein SFU98_13975 [Leptospiraceae bacterium]|nr:hypothetical protein [Leptospiraceae bacterium]
MLNQLLKSLVDLIYGIKQVRKKFKLNNPYETLLAIDGCKFIETKINQEVQYGKDWVNSQRAIILLTNKKIICGKLIIPLENILNAQLFFFGSLLGKGQVLKIQTIEGKHYQFGMQLNPEWTNQKYLSLKLENGKIKFSFYSIFIRLLALGSFAYFVYEKLLEN